MPYAKRRLILQFAKTPPIHTSLVASERNDNNNYFIIVNFVTFGIRHFVAFDNNNTETETEFRIMCVCVCGVCGAPQ